MELGSEDVSLLERCPHFRGCYTYLHMAQKLNSQYEQKCTLPYMYILLYFRFFKIHKDKNISMISFKIVIQWCTHIRHMVSIHKYGHICTGFSGVWDLNTCSY